MKRIPVLLVDDDRILLDDLVDQYDWESDGFDIVGTAVNGVQALSLFKQFHPRLVITDIVMPGMDGIGLLKEIKAIDDSVIVILLTSHDDFNYAKQGIQFAANDYILKNEVSPETLSQKLGLVKTELKKESQFNSFLQQKILNDLFRLKYQSMLASAMTDRNVEDFLQRSNFHYVVAEVKTPLYANIPETHITEELLEAVAGFTTAEITKTVATGISDRHILILLEAGDSNSQLAAQGVLHRYCSGLTQTLAEAPVPAVTLLYSGAAQTVLSFYGFYHARDIEHRYFGKFCEDGAIIDLASLPNEIAPGAFTLDMEQLKTAIEGGDRKRIHELFSAITDSMSGCHGYDAYTDIATSIYSMIDSIAYSKTFEHLDFPLVYSYHDFFDWCTATLEQHFHSRQAGFGDVISLPIKLTIEHIKSNYQSAKLSIDTMARSVYLSAGYLCTLFKAETGKSIHEYITDVRMEKAQLLLRDPSYKIYQVATMTGYSSSQYFSQIFQKYTGMTPKEYRKTN